MPLCRLRMRRVSVCSSRAACKHLRAMAASCKTTANLLPPHPSRRPGLALGDSVELWLGEIYRAVPLLAQEEVR